MFTNYVKIIDMSDNDKEIPIPESSLFDVYKEMGMSYQNVPVSGLQVLMTVIPLPGDHITVRGTTYRIESRNYHLDNDNSWVELWVNQVIAH